MPSIFGHSAAGAAASYVFKERFPNLKYGKFLALSVLAANLPDIDVITHQSPLGSFEAFTHRNFFHSLIFAALVGTFIGLVIYRSSPQRQRLELSIYFFVVTTSHAIMDAFTRGFGVAFFYPFDKTQYNFPITPLNPAGWTMREFNSNDAFLRECLLVWVPMLLICIFTYMWRSRRRARLT